MEKEEKVRRTELPRKHASDDKKKLGKNLKNIRKTGQREGLGERKGARNTGLNLPVEQ